MTHMRIERKTLQVGAKSKSAKKRDALHDFGEFSEKCGHFGLISDLALDRSQKPKKPLMLAASTRNQVDLRYFTQ